MRYNRTPFLIRHRMKHDLRDGLSFCRVGSHVIFLDLLDDRYFRLREGLEAAFLSLIQGLPISDASLAKLVDQRIIRPARMDGRFEAVELSPATRVSAAVGIPAAPLEVVRSLVAERRVESRIRLEGLAATIEALRLAKSRRPSIATIDDPQPARAIRASEAVKFVRSPANRCLSRSIALVQRLAQLGCAAHLVMAVRAAPFAAHSWVQVDDIVLNDTPEEVSRYSPIFLA